MRPSAAGEREREEEELSPAWVRTANSRRLGSLFDTLLLDGRVGVLEQANLAFKKAGAYQDVKTLVPACRSKAYIASREPQT